MPGRHVPNLKFCPSPFLEICHTDMRRVVRIQKRIVHTLAVFKTFWWRLYHLPQSQNNWTKKHALIRNLVNCIDVQLGGVKPSWEVWNPAGTTQCFTLTVRILPPVMVNLSDIGGKLYIMSAEEQFLNTQCVCHWDTLALTTSSSSSSATSSPFFYFPWERVSLTFFRVSLHQFSDSVPWVSRVVFQLSLDLLWQHSARPSLPPGHHEDHLIWVDSSMMALLE